jgi:hypothetical protein
MDEKEKCTCCHCDRVYYNTPDNYSWNMCHDCCDVWFAFGCPIEG